MLFDSLNNMNQLMNSMTKLIVGHEDEVRQMMVHLNEVSEQMSIMLENLNKGHGTLGRLMTDDEVYENMKEFTHEIKVNPWRLLKKQ